MAIQRCGTDHTAVEVPRGLLGEFPPQKIQPTLDTNLNKSFELKDSHQRSRSRASRVNKIKPSVIGHGVEMRRMQSEGDCKVGIGCRSNRLSEGKSRTNNEHTRQFTQSSSYDEICATRNNKSRNMDAVNAPFGLISTSPEIYLRETADATRQSMARQGHNLSNDSTPTYAAGGLVNEAATCRSE